MIDVLFFLMILKILNALIIFELLEKFNLIKYKLIKELMIICMTILIIFFTLWKSKVSLEKIGLCGMGKARSKYEKFVGFNSRK